MIRAKVKYILQESYGKFDEDFNEEYMIMEYKCIFFSFFKNIQFLFKN